MQPALQVNVRSNVVALTRGLTDLQRRGVPGITAGALDSTAFDVRKHEVDTVWPRSIQLRNRRFLGAALRVDKADKVRLRASVYDRLGREFLSRQATGGIKRPHRGANIAVPTRWVSRTRGGRVRSAQLPASLRANPRAFLLRARSGHQMIAQRQGKRRLPIRVLYHLTSTARVDKAFRFYEEAEDRALARFPIHFESRLARYIARRQRDWDRRR